MWVVAGLFAVTLALPLDGMAATVRDNVLGGAAVALPALVIAARAVLVPADRAWAAALALACASFTAGNVVYLSWVQYQDPLPFPTAADAGYLGFYPLALLGVLLSLRGSARRLRPGIALEAVMAGLAAAAAGVWLFDPVAPHFEGDVLGFAVSLAYPVGDVLLLTAAVAVMIVGGGRPRNMCRYLAVGLLVFVVGDAVYAYRVALDTYQVGTVLDATWALGLALVAHGAWRDDGTSRREPAVRAQSLWLPAVAGFVALAVLVTASALPAPRLTVALAAASLLLGAVRTVEAFVRVRQLAVAQAEARTDHLTGIANRRALMDELQRKLGDRPNGGVVGLAILDLDRFKDVNDSLGHQAGDELLQLVAERLSQATASDALVARLGGDEFALLATRTTADDLVSLAHRARASLQQPFELTEMTVHVSASVGAAVAPDHAGTRGDLLRCADVAMYAAKADRVGVVMYQGHHRRAGRDRLQLVEDLYRALDRGELVPYYQPKATPGGAVVGVEVLVRWLHPERGMLLPGAFLDAVEDHDLMPALTESMLVQALRDCARWWAQGRQLTVSVNISAADLQDPDLSARVMDLLLEHGLPAPTLVLEITESAVMTDPDAALRTLQWIRDVGVEISVDDYGTGHSSLAYLRRLPVQELKIDRSFVRELPANTKDLAIVESTLRMAQALGLRVVAEGVEDAETLRLLRLLGCDLVQGWHLAAAMPSEQVLPWLETHEAGLASHVVERGSDRT
ncbi:MAG: putative bifunctional diguanylate cyclase/phosphodiesterase [Actinomycetes bacterium]